MKIGLVIYGSLDTVSGGYLYDRQLVAGLRAAGDEVRIYSLPWRNYASHLADNLRIRLPADLDLLIQDELNHPSLISATRAAHPYPVVSLVHHLRCSESRPRWQNAFYRSIERSYLGSVDAFIYNSQTTRASVEALAGDSKPSIVAYPPTDRFGAALSEAAIKARAGQLGPLRVLFLGNVIPRKGLHMLLSALSRLLPGTVTLEVVGSLTSDRAYTGKVLRQVAALGLVPWVRLRGALDEAALRTQLMDAQVLAVPSSYEGYGIVYLEGMGFGLPAIGTTAGAATEIVTDGEDGFLIRPDDSSALAGHLERLAGDRGLLARMSLAARRRYQAQPGWEKTCGEIRKFLLTLG